jgi:hypothetical protein
LVSSKAGVDLRFKSLAPSGTVSIIESADQLTLTISGADTGDFVTQGMTGNSDFITHGETGYLINLGGGTTVAANPGSSGGGVLSTINIGGTTYALSGHSDVAGGGGGGGGGETNTASSVGAGTGLVSSKAGVDLRFKSLAPSGTVSIIESADQQTVTISGQRVGAGDLTSTGQVTFGTGADLLFISDTGIHFGLVPTVNQSGMVLTGSAPATDNAAGVPGQISFSPSHFYVYVETGWKRSALSAW